MYVKIVYIESSITEVVECSEFRRIGLATEVGLVPAPEKDGKCNDGMCIEILKTNGDIVNRIVRGEVYIMNAIGKTIDSYFWMPPS